MAGALAHWLQGGGPGPLTIGLLITFRSYMKTCVDNISNIARMYVQLQKAIGGTERFFAIVDSDPVISYKGGLVPPEPCRGRIEFSNVCFSYPSRPDKPILDGLNLIAPAGYCMAFCGPTGSGKSSILKLLQRYYEIDQG